MQIVFVVKVKNRKSQEKCCQNSNLSLNEISNVILDTTTQPLEFIFFYCINSNVDKFHIIEVKWFNRVN